jgi:hypothetical protein
MDKRLMQQKPVVSIFIYLNNVMFPSKTDHRAEWLMATGAKVRVVLEFTLSAHHSNSNPSYSYVDDLASPSMIKSHALPE